MAATHLLKSHQVHPSFPEYLQLIKPPEEAGVLHEVVLRLMAALGTAQGTHPIAKGFERFIALSCLKMKLYRMEGRCS